MTTTAKATYRIEGEDASAAAFASVLKNAKDTSEKMSGFFETAFAGISIAVITEFTSKLIDLGDQMETAAKKAGISGNAFSELAYAAKQSGVDAGSLSQALAIMNKNLSLASTGATAPTEALTALGLKIQNIQDLKPDQQFELLAQQISRLSSPADKARAEMELFGRAGAELGPLFDQGAAGIQKAREEAEKVGAAFSDETLHNLAEAHKAIDALESSFVGFAASLVGKVAPAITEVLNTITALANGDQIAKIEARIGEIMVHRDGLLSGLNSKASNDADTAEINRLEALIAQLKAQDIPDFGLSNGTSWDDKLPTPPGFSPGYSEADYQNLLKMMQEPFDKLDEENQKRSTEVGLSLNTQGVNTQLKEITNAHQHMWDELDRISQDGAKGMQDSFANFLIDPTVAGFKQMGLEFLKTVEKMLADATASDIFGALFGKDKEGNSGLGGILAGFLGGSFGGGGAVNAGAGAAIQPAGFATGGSFTVGGQGGVDQNLVAFRASRGEMVSISHGSQASSAVHFAPTYNINAPGGDPSSVAKMYAIAAQMGQQTKKDLLQAFDRSGLPRPNSA